MGLYLASWFASRELCLDVNFRWVVCSMFPVRLCFYWCFADIFYLRQGARILRIFFREISSLFCFAVCTTLLFSSPLCPLRFLSYCATFFVSVYPPQCISKFFLSVRYSHYFNMLKGRETTSATARYRRNWVAEMLGSWSLGWRKLNKSGKFFQISWLRQGYPGSTAAAFLTIR